ncbi:MAG: PAS domain-containing protein [Leptospira sp.]|nr:PAS domain-containing protein [Leptospira sp.]NCS95226.1 PAS domain-containing protein [Leptospira sp.]
MSNSEGEDNSKDSNQNISFLFYELFQSSSRPIVLLKQNINAPLHILDINQQFQEKFKITKNVKNIKIDEFFQEVKIPNSIANKILSTLKNQKLQFYLWLEDFNGDLLYYQINLNYYKNIEDKSLTIILYLNDSTKEYIKKNKRKIDSTFSKTLNKIFQITSNPLTDPIKDIPFFIYSFMKGFKADAILVYDFHEKFIDHDGIAPEFLFPKFYSNLNIINKELLDTVIFKTSSDFKQFISLFENKMSYLKSKLIFEDGNQYLIPILVKNQIIGLVIIHYKSENIYFNIQETHIFQISRLISNYFERVKYKEENAMFEQAFQQSKESILITDGNLNSPGPHIVYVNGSFEKMTNYSKEELIGNSPRIFQGMNTDFEMLKNLKKSISEGKPFYGETINYKKDKTEYNVEWNISPIRDSNQKITHYVSTQRDVTEKLKIEREINKRLKYEIGLAAISQILLYPNPSDDVLNLAIEQLMIFSEVTTIFIASQEKETSDLSIYKIESRREEDRNLKTIKIPNSWLLNLNNEISVISDTSRGSEEEKLFLQDRNYNSIIFFALKSNLKSQEPIFIGIAIEERNRYLSDDDILLMRTASNLIAVFLERKNYLEEIQKHRDRLQVLVEERTADLMDAKLKAEAANKAKSDFLANMTHELRTPLNSILGFSRLIQPNENFPDQQKYLDYIHNSGIHLLKLINELLDLSKIEAGKSELILSKLDFVTTVKICMESMEPQANKKNITLILNSNANHLYIIGDEKRTRQIVLNILSNAIKFSYPKTKINLILEQIVINNTDFIVLKIIDHGIGMKEDEIPIIFEKFTQLEKGKTMESQGTGLGLSICKKLIESMNGKIEVESKVEHGTTMSIFLPIYKDL